MKKNKDIILNESSVEVINDDKFNQITNAAGKEFVSKIPDIINTINDIATMNARTDNQVALIKAEGEKILAEAEAYATKIRADRDEIKARGEVIINTLDKVNEALMSSKMPDEAKKAYAENLHKWITTIVKQGE